MADIAIGDVFTSDLDNSYQRYVSWCQRLRYPAANFDSWLRIERGLRLPFRSEIGQPRGIPSAPRMHAGNSFADNSIGRPLPYPLVAMRLCCAYAA